MLLEEVTARTGSALPRSIFTLFQHHGLLIENVPIVMTQVYDPKKNVWRSIADLSAKRWKCGLGETKIFQPHTQRRPSCHYKDTINFQEH